MKALSHQPEQAQPFGKIADFLRTVASVLTRPRAFFAGQHGASSRAGNGAGVPSIKEYLGMAVGLSALIAPLHLALLRAGGFPERYLQLAGRDWKDLAHDYAMATGRDLTVVDLSHLTGISWLDAPVEDVSRLGVYALFAALFWLFSGKRLPLGLMMRYFAYGIGACMVVSTVFVLLGDALFALSSRPGSRGSMAALMAIHQLGDIPRLLFLFVVPAVIFPAIVGIPRRAVIWSIVLSTLAWGLGGLLISQAMMTTGFVIHLPSL
jgi:hypothetical protein